MVVEINIQKKNMANHGVVPLLLLLVLENPFFLAPRASRVYTPYSLSGVGGYGWREARRPTNCYGRGTIAGGRGSTFSPHFLYASAIPFASKLCS